MRKYNFSGKNSAQSSAVAPLYITKQQKEQNVGGFLGGIGYLGEKLATGFFQSLEGISDYTFGGFAKLFGADDWAEEQFENDWFGDWYTHPDEWYNPSEGWKVAGDVAGGIGTSLPSLAAGATAAGITILSGGTAAPLVAGLASAATAGLGAAGTGTKEAYKKTGQLGGKEFGYGALSGLVEGTTEGVTNALTLGTGTVLKNITKSFGKEITQTVAKQSAVKGLLGGFLGEAFEEGLSEWVNPYIARITYDADAENATAQEIFYSALIGGLSGMVMEGVNIAADTSNSFAKGAKIANSGREGEVLGLSRNLAAFQNENATENEAFRAVADTYKTLSESLALTGGKITTAAQKKQLGDLSRANVSAVFTPMITKSAANIYANAEAIADALGTYGYKDADGKQMNFTAEQIREGIDPANKKSLAGALKKNTVLRTLAVADVTGQMMMDTQKFRDATLAGKNLARRADLWRFAEEATPDEIRSVSEALGIDNWETLTEDDFADKITTFLRDGGAKRYADLRAESERIFADESEAAALPTLIALEDGQTRKYKTGEDTVAIARKGEGYRIFDYGTRQTSREMSRAEVNKALADNNLRGQAISARMQEYAEKTAEIKRKTQGTDTWARENTKGYAELSSTNKTMIRKVIRSAQENGIADEDIKTYSSISAHSGVDIVFSKRLTKVDGGYADAFYDPKKNRIVVNPEATRSAEKILLHELDHAIRTGIRKDGGTKLFADALFGISDEAMEKITARYKDMESDVSTDELIADEANAYFAETVFADKKVLESLTKKVPTLKERIISFFEGAVTDYAGAPKLEGAAKRYLKEYKKMFAEFSERNAGNNAEEARRLGKIGDARFSLQFADDIATDQRKFVIDGKAALTQEELELAIEQTAEMVAIMSEHKDILPEDKTGKTLVKNGSYDYSVENTTICVRTLAYNSFTDMVSEKIGRPLSQMESFLVSQKLYEIAKEPQCLYCYVSLDRKAYNEMILRYITQRDEAIADYISAGKPKVTESSEIYKKFLAGRKPTPQMWSRYKAWTELAANGEYIVNAGDVATEAKRADLARKNDGRAAQVKDMLKYAQSASWAKKQTQYVAYFDDIRKLSPAVIKNLNKHYGLRWYSFSDYSGAFIVENMQQVTDAALRGLKGLAYTKDTDYARIFAPTGMNINISVYAKKTENGYAIDEKQSANIEEAIELRKQFPNVGIVVVATDADGVEWALDQKWSDVVIPFHTVRTGADVADFYKWEIFNAEQNDTVSDENLWNAYVESLTGGDAKKAKKVSKMVYPSEHQNNRENYLRIINERGLKPRFEAFLANDNYMKLVNETRQSEAQTKPLSAKYDLGAAKTSFDKFVKKGGYYEGWYNDGIDVDGEASLVAGDIAAGRKANEVSYGRQDMPTDRRKNRQHGRRYALPIDDDSRMFGAKEMNEIIDEMMRDGDIAPASDIANDAPVAPKSKRQSKFTKQDAMKIVATLPHADAFSNTRRNQMVTHMFKGLDTCQTMAQKIDYSRTFAKQIIEDLTRTRENRPDLSEAIETSRKLGIGKGKLTFTQADIAELFAALGEEDARAFMKKWGKKDDVSVKYPVDVFLADVQAAAPEFTSNIDGRSPVDALLEIDRIQTDASERAKNKYVYPYAEMDDTRRAALEDKMYRAIMEGFAAADAEITAQTIKTVSDEATLWQAKLEEQTATDRDFREAMQAEFDRRTKNLAERESQTKKYYGEKVKLADISKKGAEVVARDAKKKAEAAEKRADAAEKRAEKAEVRAEKQIEAEEARADRVIEATEKNAALKIEKAEERLKKARERTEEVKAELAENKKLLADRERGYSLRASIGARVQKLTEMKKGTFENATAWGADNFKKILSTLSSVEWRQSFSPKKAIDAMKTLNEWYKPSNTLLGYVDNKNTGLYNTEMAGTIAELAALDDVSMLEAENLKSFDDVLGYFTKLIETYDKVFYRGKWVEAKPMAEGFIKSANEGKRAMPSWIKAKMQAYLDTFGDTASVVRYHDGYIPGGFWTSMLDMMREGGIKAEIEKARIMRDYEAFMKKNPKFLADAEKATVDFMGVKMPKMVAISLYMTMKRDHSHKGLAANGFQYVTEKGEIIRIDGFAPEAVRDPYAGMTAEERHEHERNDAGAKDTEYRKKRDEARSKAAELADMAEKVQKEIDEYNELAKDAPETLEFLGSLTDQLAEIKSAISAEKDIAKEYDMALKDEKKSLELFRESGKAERAKALLGAIEAKRSELEATFSEADLEYIKILEAGYAESGKLKEMRDIEKYGFTNVTGGYYYPIRRANTAKSIDVDFAAELDRVSNASFNKDTVQGAAGELFIQNADTLFRNHAGAVAQYYALSPTIDAYDRIFNVDVSGNPNRPVSVRTEMQNVWKDGNEFMRDLMGDIQGVPRKRGKGAKTFDKIRGGYAKYQLGLNVKTWLGQFSSGFAAMSILDYSSTAKAVANGKKISHDVDTYCELAKLRNADNTVAMAQGASLPGRIYGKIGKFADLMMAPMGKIDRLVVHSEFAVCQAQVAKNGGPAIGTEENRVAAGKLLEKIILETQQNTLATERSAAMRSGSEIMRTLTMFSADSMKVFGRVIDSFGEVTAIKRRIAETENSLLDSAGDDKAKRKQIADRIAEAEKAAKSKKAAKTEADTETEAAEAAEVQDIFAEAENEEAAEAAKKAEQETAAELTKISELKKALAAAKRKQRKSVGALVASSIYMAFVAQFLRHLFDKEEDDEDVETVLLMMLADTGGNLTGGLPIIRDVVSYISDGFGVEDISLSAMNDLLSLSGQLVSFGEKAFTGELKVQDTMRLSRNGIYSLAQLVGLPTRNVDNLVKAFNKRLLPETAYRVDELFYEKNYKNDLARAIEDGDTRMANFLLSLATGERIGTTFSETAHAELYRLAAAGYNVLPHEIGKTITIDGTEYAIGAEEQEMIRTSYADVTDKIEKLAASKAYARLSDSEKSEALRYVYNTAYDAALTDVYGIDRGNAAIIAETVGYDTAALAYIRTKGLESDKDKSGKTVSGSKRKKTIAEINKLATTTENKLLLICAKGYALADGDIKGLSAEAAKKRLLRYIINMPGKTKAEKAELADICGFTVSNGKIITKTNA